MLEELKNKAESLMKDENVKNAVDKAKEFLNSEKGKEVVETAKEKVENIVNGKESLKDIFKK